MKKSRGPGIPAPLPVIHAVVEPLQGERVRAKKTPEEGCASRHVKTLSGEGLRAQVCMKVRTRGVCIRCSPPFSVTRCVSMRGKVRTMGVCIRYSRPFSVHYNQVLPDAVVVEELPRVTP